MASWHQADSKPVGHDQAHILKSATPTVRVPCLGEKLDHELTKKRFRV